MGMLASRLSQNPDFHICYTKIFLMVAGLGKILSADATKLTLACKPPCKTGDMKPMVKGMYFVIRTYYLSYTLQSKYTFGFLFLKAMQDTVKRISGFFHTIPPSIGKTYVEHIRKLARSLFNAAITLCKSLAEAKDADKIDKILKSTGSVWEICKSFETQVVRNNREAVEKNWKDVCSMVSDAQEELQGFIAEQSEEEEDVDDGGWGEIMENGTKMTSVQLEACQKCHTMIKMTSMMLKKVQLRCIKDAKAANETETNAWLDDLNDAGHNVSDQVDVLASSFYEEDTDLKECISSFVASAISLISIVEAHVKEEEHVRWFQVSSGLVLRPLESG